MKVMAVLSVSLSKNIDKRMEKEYTLIDKVFFDLTVMSTDQEEKKEAIKCPSDFCDCSIGVVDSLRRY